MPAETSDHWHAAAYDAIVIGSGFGGSVAALRLVQAQKKVCLLERGRRFGPGDFPRPLQRPDNLPETSRWLWALDQGLFDVRDLQGTLAVQAAGFGGGSLIYANVHLRPPEELFHAGWPAGYSRTSLEPYYDRVANMLQVAQFPDDTLPKLAAFRTAATQLNRGGWFFKPQLAIDFGKCVMCAECIVGCPHGAKNTLDRTYLKEAEDNGLEVRTRCEVKSIEDRGGTYRVTYTDHFDDTDVTETAKSVFLCAGALNSTELLLRSKDALHISDAAQKRIGQRFFTNGDALAMVFDTKTRAVPTRGPTITAALLHKSGPPPTLLDWSQAALRPKDREWFLIQDGGYPAWLEDAIGIFRGRFWLRRNVVGAGTSPNAPPAPSLIEIDELLRAVFGVLQARGSLRVQDDQWKTGMLAAGSPVPPQVRQIADLVRRWILEHEKETATALSEKTAAEVVDELVSNHQGIMRCIVEALAAVAAPQVEPLLPNATIRTVNEAIFGTGVDPLHPLTAKGVERLLLRLVAATFFGGRPGANSFLMLAMGVDAAPGRLWLDGGLLVADWDTYGNMPISSREECLMQDLAKEMGGELRFNPQATASQQPVSVHNLGGCGMADDDQHGVTDPGGKVWGTRALYVLDGAALPGAIGANPSATIAAIAERNIRLALSDRSSPIYYRPVDASWPDKAPTPCIDPMPRRTDDAPHTRAQPVGLSFVEIMRGSFCPNGVYSGVHVEAHLTATIRDLNRFLVDPDREVDLAGTLVRGNPGAPPIQDPVTGCLRLLRRVEDTGRLLDLFRMGEELLAPKVIPSPVPTDRSRLAWLLQSIEEESHNYRMDYDLTFTSQPARHLLGSKTIDGGPGLAAWTQTTTLPFKILENGAALDKGTLHVHLADLLGVQLPSFTVLNTDEAPRQTWAFGRFFRFFFQTLSGVYLPHLRLPNPLA